MAGDTDDESFHSSDASDVMVEEGGLTSVESPSNDEQNGMLQDPPEEPRELSELEKRRAEKIKRNMQRFEQLGLLNARECLNDPATPQDSITRSKTAESCKRPASVPVAPVRRSPRLMEQEMVQEELRSPTTNSSSTSSSSLTTRRGRFIATVVPVSRKV